MQGFAKVINHYFELLESSITRICEREASKNRSTQLDPDKILKDNFNEGCIVILNLCPGDFDEILALLVNKIVETGSVSSNNLQKADEVKFTTYCALARLCMDHVSMEKVFNSLTEPILLKITMLSIHLFSDINCQYSDYSRKAYTQLFSFIGDHCDQIYQILLLKLKSEFKKPADPLEFQNALNPFIRLSSNPRSLAKILSLLTPIIKDTPDNCKPCLSQSIVDMVLSALRYKPMEMYDFFQEGNDLKNAANLIPRLTEWDQRRYGISFIAKCALFPMFPAAMANSFFAEEFDSIIFEISKADYISGFLDTFFKAINTGFYFVSQTKSFDVFGRYTRTFFTTVMDFIERAIKRLLEAKDNNTRALLVHYGLALYFHDNNLFCSRFLPILISSTLPSNGHFVCKFISHLCRHTDLYKYPIELSKGVITVLDLVTSDKAYSPHIIHVYKGFAKCPQFFENIMRTDHSFLTNVIKSAYDHNSYQLCLAFLKFFEPSRMKIMHLDIQMLQCIVSITSTFSSLTVLSALHQSTTFIEYIPEVLLQIAQFMFASLSEIPLSELETSAHEKELKGILNNLEVTALSLMVTSRPHVCKVAVAIIGEILNILRQANLYQNTTSPIEAYQALVTNCKNRSSVQAMDSYFMKSLMLIQKPSSVIHTVWNTIFSYFNSLLNVIAQEKCMMDMPVQRIKKDSSTLHDELPNVLSLLLSLLLPSKENTINIIHNFIKYDDFVGQVATDCLSTALLPAFYTTIAKLMVNTLNSMKSTTGNFESNNANNIYVKHAVKVMRNILRHPYYDDNPIDLKTVAKFVMDSTAYCNSLSLIDFHVLCGHLIIAFINRHGRNMDISSKKVLANTLGLWITKPDFQISNKSATTILIDALTLLLEGIEFDQDQKEQKFKYYVSIAHMVLKEQPKLKDHCQRMLTSLFRKNFELAIANSMSDFFSTSILARVAFLSAIATVLKNPEPVMEQKEETKEEDFIDILFETRFQLIDIIIDLVPFNKSEAVGINLLEASVTKNLHYELCDFIISCELKSIQEATKHTIFRGNGIPSRLISYFPRLFGQEWLDSNFKPMILNIITQIEKGVKCQINPQKITDGSSLQLNRENFHSILVNTIETLLNALRNLPVPIIRMTQMIYHRINQEYEGTGLQIVYGFLFLRFIFPAFTVTSILGLPSNMNEDARQCLMTISIIMLASITKGNLDEKGDFYLPFNELAMHTHVEIDKTVMWLMTLDLTDQSYEDFPIDKLKVIAGLQGDLCDIIRPLETKVMMYPESDPIRKSAEKFMSLCKASRGSVNMNNAVINNSVGSSQAFNKFMASTFKNEPMEALNKWFYKDKTRESSNVDLYILDNTKLPEVSDVNVLAYKIFATIASSDKSFYVIADFSKFEKNIIPKFSSILKYKELAPLAMKMNNQGIFVICACEDFTSWLSENKDKMLTNKFIFPKTMEDITNKLGFEPTLSQMGIESLSPYESVHTARYEGNLVAVRLHLNTVQIITPIQGIPNDPFSIVIIKWDQIQSVERNNEGFQFFYNHKLYVLQTIEGSNLYALFGAAYHRATVKHSVLISLDHNTFHWLLLIIAFANIVDNCNDPSLNFAAFQVINHTYLVYDFKRTASPLNCPEHLMPPSCKTMVATLSWDLARNNPDQTAQFISEYFKSVQKLNQTVISDTVVFLAPWVENLLIEKADLITLMKVVNFYFDCKPAQMMFNNLIWSKFSDGPTMEFLFEFLSSLNSKHSPILINFIAKLNLKFSSEYWTLHFDDPLAQSAIHSLLMGDAFYATAVPALFYKIIAQRHKLDKEGRISMSKLLNNLLAMLTLHCNFDCQMSISKMVELYINSDESSDFEKFVEDTTEFCSMLGATLGAMGMFSIRVELYKQFESQLFKNHDFYSTAISAIFCCGLFMGVADQLVCLVLRFIHFGEHKSNIVLCHSFSLLELSERLCACFIIISIIILFNSKIKGALKLLSRVVYENSVNLMMYIPQSISLSEYMQIPLIHRPIYSLALIAAAFDESDTTREMVLRMHVYDAAMGVLSVQYRPENIVHVENLDWGEDWVTIAALSLACFMRHPEVEETFMLVKKYIQRNDLAFGCFNWYKEFEKRNITKYFDDDFKMFEIQKINPTPQQRSYLNPLIAQLFSENKLPLIPEENALKLINELVATF